MYNSICLVSSMHKPLSRLQKYVKIIVNHCSGPTLMILYSKVGPWRKDKIQYVKLFTYRVINCIVTDDIQNKATTSQLSILSHITYIELLLIFKKQYYMKLYYSSPIYIYLLLSMQKYWKSKGKVELYFYYFRFSHLTEIDYILGVIFHYYCIIS